jgi:outer membrane protein
MMAKYRAAALLGAVLAFGLVSAASAQQQDIVGASAAYLSNHSSAPDISGPFTPPGGNLDVGDATTLELSYVHKFDDHWGFAFLFGIPPKIDTKGEGTLQPLGRISTVTVNTPTFLAQYYFTPYQNFQPYIGLGINFTNFSDANASPSLNEALGGPTSIKLQNSVGVAGQIGVRYPLSEHWAIDAHLVAADVRSRETSTTGYITRSTTIDFNPIVYSVGVQYSF